MHSGRLPLILVLPLNTLIRRRRIESSERTRRLAGRAISASRKLNKSAIALDGRLEVQFYTKYRFPQGIRSRVQEVRTTRPIDTYEAIDRDTGTRRTGWLYSQVASTLNTAPRGLILGRGIKYILKKRLAEFEADQSTTSKDLQDGSSGRSTIVKF